MVHYQRNHVLVKKGGMVDGDEEDESHHHLLGLVWGNSGYNKRAKPNLLFILFLSLLSCSFIFAPHLFSASPPTFSLLYSFGFEGEGLASEIDLYASLCSSVPNGTICCDRSSFRSDVCIMKGDVRTDPASSSIALYRSYSHNRYILGLSGDNDEAVPVEKIKPYTRKWETSVMDTIDELDLVVKNKKDSRIHHACDVQHDVPAVVFSTGGYTGNVYHEFNDGILPLYITSQPFDRKVVFVILEYHDWWISKYENILSRLSEYPAVDFRDNRTHCFPEVIVGLKIHDELSIDPSLMKGNKSIRDFRQLLDRAYLPRITGLIKEEEREAQLSMEKSASSPSPNSKTEIKVQKQNLKSPKLVIVARNDSRAILNEGSLVKMAEEIGFQVEVLRPARTTELARIYRALNLSDVMIGVHGAAMTHFLFLKPESVFIQIIPLGTDWAAEAYYGDPAKKMGLRYIGYKILPNESSLYDEYDSNNAVLTDPDSVNKKGWEFTKKIYLDHQNVRLHPGRFRKRLLRAYYYTIAMKRNHQSQ
nr:EGF domain-specific O-linked N-acetylglucosamine transferase-like [Ipomoea batatas]GMD47978.1 EGF domain-specific O-linked N-acetylglucosamine transferase-like [Ipomoea batatas]GME08633.1 EGF domain-specific O-linked N-acetylglucosamine transferase-like [Ipomoea batatas]